MSDEIFLVAVRINYKNELFSFDTKKKQSKFISTLKKLGVEYCKTIGGKK